MNVINKQKFLAELGRLLTFMYEEDRQTALEMYNDMFACSEDEQALIQRLVSPTRQAVVLARAYDAKERKLQVHSQSREADGAPVNDAVPDFVVAINRLRQELVGNAAVALEDKNQLSLFDQFESAGENSPSPEDAAEPENQPVDEVAALPFYGDPVPEEVISETPPLPAEEDAPLYAQPSEAVPEPSLSEAKEDKPLPEESEVPSAEVEPEAETNESLFSEDVPAAETGESLHSEDKPDTIDSFLADFSIANNELSPPPEDGFDPLPQPAAESAYEAEGEAATLYPGALPVITKSPLPVFDEEEGLTRRKPKVFLLVLFIIFAIPITLVGIAILLIPTLLFLALSIGVFSLGATILSSAFVGFTVLADIMVVLGAALIVLALGVLFAWIFVWFIGSVITGLIRGVIRLGGRWCYKEVPVE